MSDVERTADEAGGDDARLRTPRLLLTPLTPADAVEMVSVLSSAELYAFTGGAPPSLEQLEARYTAQSAGSSVAGERWSNWIVRLAETRRAVGYVQATVSEDRADVAWVIGADWQHRGFAIEAASSMCEWLRAHGVSCVTAHIHPDHHRSTRVAEAIGLRRTDERDDDGEVVWSSGVIPSDTRAIWEANAPDWIELSRAGFDVYRDLVNTPAFVAMLPPMAGTRCLDFGCGEGHNTRIVADLGTEVVALDISDQFIRAASGVVHPRVRYVLADGLSLPFAPCSFDVVTAFMSMMDVADPERALTELARVLRPGGLLQFSIVHPATSTPIRSWQIDAEGRRTGLTVGDYFDEGPVEETWTFGAAPPDVRARVRPFEITYARRTLSSWLNAVVRAGLTVTALGEPRADEATARRHPEVADTRIVPYFLIVQARRTRGA